MTTTCTSQAELDAAIAAGESDIVINSPAGVWLDLRAPKATRVHAWDSSTVTARGSSTVTAWDSSTVTAWGSSTVTARDSSSVTATAYVAVHLHSGRAKVEGGHIIDVTALDLTDPATFAAYTGGPLLLTNDGRGHRLTYRDGHYEAGCRRFTHAEAVAHWSNPEHAAPKSAALLLAAVEAHAQEAS